MAAFNNRVAAAQTEFNLQRWAELLQDASAQRIEGRVETDRGGALLITPPQAADHGRLMAEVGYQLHRLMPHGKGVIACPISTAEGVRLTDVAWLSHERWTELGDRSCFVHAPEICVEVLTPSNREEEIHQRMQLYFEAGAEEVWTCAVTGKMTFFTPDFREHDRPAICPSFPSEVE